MGEKKVFGPAEVGYLYPSPHKYCVYWYVPQPLVETRVTCYIGLVYSVIAPIILFFSAFCFGVLWMLYRAYPPKLTDSDLSASTLFYPTAIRQLFTGIYFMELCLSGLFFLVRDEEDKASCTAQAVIMIIVTAMTALFHCTLVYGYKPRWLALSVFDIHKKDQSGVKKQPERVKERPTITYVAAQRDPNRDDIITSRPLVLWLPKDRLGVSDDEIYHTMRTKGLWVSNKGARLEGARVKLSGTPP